ncbi:MAG: hypothetical protein LWX83_18225, partial [Anaerolineae bacterium]|nr:hypothetical protein [Anaerolineae bacterium]
INEPQDEIKIALTRAGEAMRQKDKAAAFFWASQAARLSPYNEDAWLIMAAVSSPRDSLIYLNRVLQINPQNWRAREGIAWANKRLLAAQQAHSSPPPVKNEAETPGRLKHSPQSKNKLPETNGSMSLFSGWAAWSFCVWAALF